MMIFFKPDHFEWNESNCSACNNNCFCLSVRWITWFISQQPTTDTDVEHLTLMCPHMYITTTPDNETRFILNSHFNSHNQLLYLSSFEQQLGMQRGTWVTCCPMSPAIFQLPIPRGIEFAYLSLPQSLPLFPEVPEKQLSWPFFFLFDEKWYNKAFHKNIQIPKL